MSRDRSFLLFQRNSLIPRPFRATGARCFDSSDGHILTSDQEFTLINFSIPEWGASAIHCRPAGRGQCDQNAERPAMRRNCRHAVLRVARPPKDDADQTWVASDLPGCVPAR
jgi:hypothetical protein